MREQVGQPPALRSTILLSSCMALEESRTSLISSLISLVMTELDVTLELISALPQAA